MKSSTLAISPYDKIIDIGPLIIDLWRYLKTELYNHWSERTRSPLNYRDKYFCYYSNSRFKPEPKHFSHFSD